MHIFVRGLTFFFYTCEQIKKIIPFFEIQGISNSFEIDSIPHQLQKNQKDCGVFVIQWMNSISNQRQSEFFSSSGNTQTEKSSLHLVCQSNVKKFRWMTEYQLRKNSLEPNEMISLGQIFIELEDKYRRIYEEGFFNLSSSQNGFPKWNGTYLGLHNMILLRHQTLSKKSLATARGGILEGIDQALLEMKINHKIDKLCFIFVNSRREFSINQCDISMKVIEERRLHLFSRISSLKTRVNLTEVKFEELLATALAFSNMILPKLQNQELFEKEECQGDPKQVPRLSKKTSLPVGYRNMGKTCYLNSVLQCILQSKSFVDYLFNKNKFGPFSEAFYSLLISVQSTERQSQIWPCRVLSRILESARSRNIPLELGVQQDAHECLSIITTSIGEENLDAVLPFPFVLFETITKCLGCNNLSTISSQLTEISLPIPTSRRAQVVQLQSCFDLFVQEEMIKHYQCTSCNCQKKGLKKDKFISFPETLILHLKRFTREGTKISTVVSFAEILDLSRFQKNSRLELFGVISHSGESLNNGHYVAFVKNLDLETGKRTSWFHCDDKTVAASTVQQVLRSQAYLLFYQKTT